MIGGWRGCCTHKNSIRPEEKKRQSYIQLLSVFPVYIYLKSACEFVDLNAIGKIYKFLPHIIIL